MANPFVLFENILEDGTLSQTTGAAATGYPLANMLDWRMGTPFRWKASTTGAQVIRLDLGGGNTAQPDTFAIGGHNLYTAGATYKIEYSDDAAAWSDAFTAVTPADNLPYVKTFTVGAAHRYWRLNLPTGGFSVAAQIGIATLGRSLDFEGGANPDLDVYGFRMELERATNNDGSPLGVNVLHETRRFGIRYGGGNDPGFTTTGFWDASSGLNVDDDFAPHVKAGKPFWFSWNNAVEVGKTWLCHCDGWGNPFVGSTLRRGWDAEFIGYRETA